MADENAEQTAALAHVSDQCKGLGRDVRALAAVSAGFRAGAKWERERWRAALEAELARVSHVEYPARPLVEHYLEQVRKRLGIL